jgi:hypothetical protein
MMGERRVMQEALFHGFCLERQSPTITCFARSTVLWTFQRFGGIWSLFTARRAVLRSILS